MKSVDLRIRSRVESQLVKSCKAGVAFKDIVVWIGIKCVITSLRQARPLCRGSRHMSREGRKIKRADVLPQPVISGHKAIKQKLLSKPSFDTPFLFFLTKCILQTRSILQSAAH